MKIFLALFIQCLLGGKLFSQGLSAYLNTRNAFCVFDDSTIKEIDYLKPQNFKIGGNCIAYIANDGSFKVYQKGRVVKVNDGFTTDYTMTNNYVVMKNNTSLHVYDNGKTTLLVRNPYDFVASDSIIGFADPVTKAYYIYTKGKISALTNDLIGDAIKVNAVGKNLLAYTTVNDSLKIYYHGNLYPQPVQNVKGVKAGKNIVAYRNEYDSDLKVFYKGETFTLETFEVRIYFAGDDLVAYLTQEGKFKIFYAGVVYTIGTFNPGNLRVADDLVTFSNEVGYFKVFYKGKTYQLEQYSPDHYEMSQHSLYYTGRDGRINLFSFGKQSELPIENYVSLRLDYDVLQVETSPHQFSFYYKGKVY
ncbi:MAG TPA: hypothetical protein PLD84_02865 [Chitinophagales bacterium]|nr:hypothetical protein [Chitinophagales bacterium]